ncbi:STAS/SEC14 domain-containing protein [Hymenobacter koreensis]|uniref:STAS/SEC14 domain-containing protein n=1 Tax=Hymenobacter koreensis TaxID=1084523 RepID=A0ABP8JKP6_9BACT
MPIQSAPSTTSVHFRNAAGFVGAEPGAYVYLAWTGEAMSSADMRALYNEALQALKQLRLTKILSDHRQMPPILPIDQQWLAQDWVPRAIGEASYECCAVVQSQNVFNRLGTAQVIMQLTAPLVIKYFDDLAAAAAWLQRQ